MSLTDPRTEDSTTHGSEPGPFPGTEYRTVPATNAIGISKNQTPARRRHLSDSEKGVIRVVGIAALVAGGFVWFAVNGGPIPEIDDQVLDLGSQNGWSFEVHFTNKHQINATYEAPDGSRGRAEIMDAAHGTLLGRGENKYSNLDGLTIGAYALNYGVCSPEAAVLHASSSGKWTATSIPMDHLAVGATGVSVDTANSVSRSYILGHDSIGLSCLPAPSTNN